MWLQLLKKSIFLLELINFGRMQLSCNNFLLTYLRTLITYFNFATSFCIYNHSKNYILYNQNKVRIYRVKM